MGVSFGGMLAAGLSGLSNTLNQQAAGDIDQKRRIDIARETAAIEEQMRMRLAEHTDRIAAGAEVRRSDQLFKDEQRNYERDTSDGRVGKKREIVKGDAIAAGEAQRAVKVAEVGDKDFQAAKTAEATQTADRERDLVKRAAEDKDYMSANWRMLMNDPRVKGAYTASMASAGASAAQARMVGEQYKQLVEVGARASQLRQLQNDLANAPDDATRESVQQKISALGFQGKDPAKFLKLASDAQDNVRDALKILSDPAATDEAKAAARTSMAKAQELSSKAAAAGGLKLDATAPVNAPPVGTKVDGYTFQGGDPKDAKNWTQDNGKSKPQSKGMLATPEQPADPAQAQLAQARAALAKYGSIQRQRDPAGYQAAVEAVQAAEAAIRKRVADEPIPEGADRASFRYATP
jgi:hypothetical protein